jgi:hypothetical protein
MVENNQSGSWEMETLRGVCEAELQLIAVLYIKRLYEVVYDDRTWILHPSRRAEAGSCGI